MDARLLNRPGMRIALTYGVVSKDLADQLKSLGYNPRIRSRQNWRIGLNRLQYDDIQQVAQKLSQDAGNAEIVVGAFLTDCGDSHLARDSSLMPASHLHPIHDFSC